jgi:glycosyltransferase involved in cell wall biosynthesis
MKIAYLSTFYPLRGGIAQFNAALYRILEQKHQIQAYTFSRQYPNFLFPGTTQYVTPDDKPDRIPAKVVLDSFNPLSYIKAAKIIRQYKPDLMITKFWMPYFAPSFGYVSKRLKKSGCINISILDNIIPHERRPGDTALTKYFLRQNHAFVVMSETVQRDLLSLNPNVVHSLMPHPLYDIFGDRILTTEARKKLNIPADAKVLLFFGFIRSYKGLDILIEAIGKLPDDYYLLIAGEPYGDFNEYDKLIDKYNLKIRTGKYVRYISDDEVPTFFSASDVCVLPYKTATQSGITAIALHFDVPVIATDVGGLRETIEKHGTGVIVPQPDPGQIAKAISDFFDKNNKSVYHQKIAEYKSAASWQNFADSILELYNKVKRV